MFSVNWFTAFFISDIAFCINNLYRLKTGRIIEVLKWYILLLTYTINSLMTKIEPLGNQ